MGDAAHAMTPWQGSGASQAIEDAMILQILLKEIHTPFQLNAVLRAYDHVRRPRSRKVIDSSRVTGVMMCGRAPDVGLDAEKLRDALEKRWDFILNLDMRKHQDEAVKAIRDTIPAAEE